MATSGRLGTFRVHVDQPPFTFSWTPTRFHRNSLERAFPRLQFFHSAGSRFSGFATTTKVAVRGATHHPLAPRIREDLRRFLELMANHLLIADSLDETFALDCHHIESYGEVIRTPVGRLVYWAKPYNSAAHRGNAQRATELGGHMASFILSHPKYRDTPLLVPAPPSNPDKPFDLPERMAFSISEITGQRVLQQDTIRKIRKTTPMKQLVTRDEKRNNIYGTVDVQPGVVAGASVIVIDDIYDSGETLAEVARALREGGAVHVFGLTATKTKGGFE